MTKKRRIKAELESVAAGHGGLLTPAHVEAFARSKKTALHSRFEWNDKKAGYQHRLWQARKIIHTFVIISEVDHKPTRAWVSLREDRAEVHGGYRTLVSVLTDEDRRDHLLSDAMRDLVCWQEKYKRLVELAPVFEAISAAKGKFRNKKGKRKGR